jgi:hypothetical protein
MVGQSKATIAANAISDYLDWRIPQTEAPERRPLPPRTGASSRARKRWIAVFRKYGA